MYVHSPCEPQGNPYQPGSDVRPETTLYYFTHTDLTTIGRCGHCQACPKVWELDAPLGFDEDSATWGGKYYLRRNPYVYRGSFSEYQNQNCCFEQQPNETIIGANPNMGIDGHGWLVAFLNDGNWHIITPIIENIFFKTMQSSYRFISDPKYWNCMGPNTFRYFGRLGEFDFPYVPEFLTITPFYP